MMALTSMKRIRTKLQMKKVRVKMTFKTEVKKRFRIS